jgi:hypothetical protein
MLVKKFVEDVSSQTHKRAEHRKLKSNFEDHTCPVETTSFTSGIFY